MVAFLGIDAGTTSLKAALFDMTGRALAVDLQEYQLKTPAPSWVELEAKVYWQVCCRAIRNVLSRANVEGRQVAALAISSQGETLIPVDADGQPTRPAIVWLDNRATDAVEWISSAFDAKVLHHTTGQVAVTPTWPACKILWMRRHEPGVFARSVRFLLLEDYLLYRLTGRFVTERCLQTSSLLLDIQSGTWWEPMLGETGITSEQLGELMDPGEVAGPLSPDGAKATGLAQSTVAVCGGMDVAVGAIGAGNITPGMITETTGSVLAELATLERPLFDPERRAPCHYHALAGRYCLLPWGQTAGMALRWFRDQFFGLERRVAEGAGIDGYEIMTGLAARVPAGCDGLVVLPHLEGAACPEFNPAARAVFFGATLRHTRGHFVRAILEAVAYMLKRHVDIIEDLGVTVGEVSSLGGGARSRLWLQIKADVLQKPVVVVPGEEVACLGAALMAAVATGAFSSLEEGVRQMVRRGETVHPREEHRLAYQEGYAAYIELYERLAPMFR